MSLKTKPIRAGLACVGAAALLLGFTSTSAFATITPTANPGVTGTSVGPRPGKAAQVQDGQVVWTEDFGSSAMATPLGSYTGSTGEQYTAGSDWLPPTAPDSDTAKLGGCNGWVLTSGSTNPNGSATKYAVDYGCSNNGGQDLNGNTHSGWWYLQQMATALGTAQGIDATTNAVVSSETNNGNTLKGTDSTVQFQQPSVNADGTMTPTATAIAGHYYVASIWVAATHCAQDDTDKKGWTSPDQTLDLTVDNNTVGSIHPTKQVCDIPAIPVQASDNDPVNGGVNHGKVDVHVLQIVTDPIQVTSGGALGIQLLNGQLSSFGNDVAFDTPMITDVTPQIDKTISTGEIAMGGTATLTFTITNTTDLLAKPGMSFTDTLPAGVTATSDAAAGTCLSDATKAANFTVDTSDPTKIVVKGDLLAGADSCTVTVDVTSTTAGTYENGPDAAPDGTTGGNDFGAADGNGGYADLTGLWAPNPVDLKVDGPALSIVKATTTKVMPAAGGTIPYTFHVVNTGNVTMYNVIVGDDKLAGSPIDCKPAAWPMPNGNATLAPGETMDCTVTYTVTTGDVNNEEIVNQAEAAGFTDPTCTWTTAADGHPTPVNGCDQTTANSNQVVVPGAPTLTLLKTADKTTLVAGDTVTYSFLVTNTGTATADKVYVTDDSFTGTGTLSAIGCPVTTLAPGASTTCTATYVVTADDVSAGKLDNTATAHGLGPSLSPVSTKMVPDQVPVNSNPSSVEITVPAVPVWWYQAPTGGGVTGAMVMWPMLALMVTGGAVWLISWRRKLAAA